jgi:hypothetical protein
VIKMEEEKPSKSKEKSDMVDRAILAILNTYYKGPTWPWFGPVDEPEKKKQNKRWLYILLWFCRRTD